MFWRTQEDDALSHINTLLNKKNVTLKEILDDPFTLQEVKCDNRLLINYLTRSDIIVQLIQLCLMDTDPNDNDNLKRYKYNRLSSEIVATEVKDIVDAFASNDQCLKCLVDFISTDEPFNSLLASFFARILPIFVHRQPQGALLFFRKEPTFIRNCIKRMDSCSITESLMQICLGVSAELSLEIKQYLCEMQFLPCLLDLFSSSTVDAYSSNVALLITGYIKHSCDLLISNESYKDPILDEIHSFAFINDLAYKIRCIPYNDTCLDNVCRIFITLLITLPCSIKLNDVDPFKPFIAKYMNYECRQFNSNAFNKIRSVILDSLSSHLECLVTILEQCLLSAKASEEKRLAQLGKSNLSVIRLLVQMITFDHFEIHERLKSLNLISHFMSSLLVFRCNSLVCSKLLTFVYFILHMKLTAFEDNDASCPSPFLDYLLQDGYIWNEIIKAYDTFKNKAPRYSKALNTTLAFATLLSNAEESSVHKDRIINSFNTLSDEIKNVWNEFKVNVLAQRFKMNMSDETLSKRRDILSTLVDDSIHNVDSTTLRINEDFSIRDDYLDTVEIAKNDSTTNGHINDVAPFKTSNLISEMTSIHTLDDRLTFNVFDDSKASIENSSEVAMSFEAICDEKSCSFSDTWERLPSKNKILKNCEHSSSSSGSSSSEGSGQNDENRCEESEWVEVTFEGSGVETDQLTKQSDESFDKNVYSCNLAFKKCNIDSSSKSSTVDDQWAVFPENQTHENDTVMAKISPSVNNSAESSIDWPGLRHTPHQQQNDEAKMASDDIFMKDEDFWNAFQ